MLKFSLVYLWQGKVVWFSWQNSAPGNKQNNKNKDFDVMSKSKMSPKWKRKKLSFLSLKVASILEALSLPMLSKPLEHECFDRFISEGSFRRFRTFKIDFDHVCFVVETRTNYTHTNLYELTLTTRPRNIWNQVGHQYFQLKILFWCRICYVVLYHNIIWVSQKIHRFNTYIHNEKI